MSAILRKALLVTLMLSANTAFALSFTPTRVEWTLWPEYCRARYIVSAAGKNSDFGGGIKQSQIKSWKSRLGNDAWYALHHHCAGMIMFKRAAAASTAKKRKGLLVSACGEHKYTLKRTRQENPIYSLMLTHLAKCNFALGKVKDAHELAQEAERLHPTMPEPYAARSIFYYRKGQYSDAKNILETGISQISFPSGELHYFLGLTCLKLKEYESSVEHAQTAYRLGYPLPGLAQKLKKAGYSVNLHASSSP